MRIIFANRRVYEVTGRIDFVFMLDFLSLELWKSDAIVVARKGKDRP